MQVTMDTMIRLPKMSLNEITSGYDGVEKVMTRPTYDWLEDHASAIRAAKSNIGAKFMPVFPLPLLNAMKEVMGGFVVAIGAQQLSPPIAVTPSVHAHLSFVTVCRDCVQAAGREAEAAPIAATMGVSSIDQMHRVSRALACPRRSLSSDDGSLSWEQAQAYDEYRRRVITAALRKG